MVKAYCIKYQNVNRLCKNLIKIITHSNISDLPSLPDDSWDTSTELQVIICYSYVWQGINFY